jgi:hypothetical protein
MDNFELLKYIVISEHMWFNRTKDTSEDTNKSLDVLHINGYLNVERRPHIVYSPTSKGIAACKYDSIEAYEESLQKQNIAITNNTTINSTFAKVNNENLINSTKEESIINKILHWFVSIFK